MACSTTRTVPQMVATLAKADSALQPGAPATAIANTPAGGLTATTVQAALDDLDGRMGDVASALDVLNGEVI